MIEREKLKIKKKNVRRARDKNEEKFSDMFSKGRVCQMKQRTEWRQKHNEDNECESHFGKKKSIKKFPK